jgi:hypothetical protein
MSRFFTLTEAESLLPEVEQALRDALFHKAEYDKARTDLESSLDRIRMAGGMRVNPGPLLVLRTQRDDSVAALKGALDQIQAAGVLIKDLDIGLIDFPAQYRGREVYLCWKLGEEGIGYWHDIEEGFRGRKPIDDEFRENLGPVC